MARAGIEVGQIDAGSLGDVVLSSSIGIIKEVDVGTNITAGEVTFNGNVAPGGSPGRITIDGDIIFGSDDTFIIELDGTTAGTSYDQLQVIGTSGHTIMLGNATLNLTLGFTPVQGDSFIIIDNVNPLSTVTETFHGLPEGAILWISGQRLNITYSGGDGNDVVLTVLEKWEVLTYDDFESGWGNYTDGGKDCGLYTDGMYAHQGSNAANIQDSSGTSSSFFHTDGIDIDTIGYTQIEVDFWFYSKGMEPDEDFLVQYYDGSSWQTVATYTNGIDFENGQFYHQNIKIHEGSYLFLTNMKIRFVCNASNNGDDIFIDEVVVLAFVDEPDTTAPEPNPMTWEIALYATGSNSIAMEATEATRASDVSGVEYYFDCLTVGGHDSGWQDSPIYEDVGLLPNTEYTYQVRVRDKSTNQNEAAFSTAESAITLNTSDWTVLTYDDFESGFGNYSDGGGDCSLYTSGTYAHQGSNAVNIQDNSSTSSSFYHTDGIDVNTPDYTQIEVDFWFYAKGMESGETLLVQYYDGTSWQTVESYISGIDFENDQFYNQTIYINEAAYTFSSNIKIRFMCDASNNGDDIYIDEVRISAR